MFRSLKSAIGRAGELINDESSYSTQREPAHAGAAQADRDSSPLGRLLDDLKASEARRNGKYTNSEPETSSLPAAETPPAPVAETPPAPAAETPPVEMKVEIAMPIVETAAPNDEALNGAHRLILEQRKAAEALLSEVCALEEQLKSEAKVAQAAAEFAAAGEKAKAAGILEQQAKELAKSASDRHRALATERKDVEMRIAELEKQLSVHQARAKECAAEEAAAERKAAEAAERVAACQAASVVAQKEAKTAQDRVEALKKELPQPAQNLAGINEVQSLAVRIAEQASALTRS